MPTAGLIPAVAIASLLLLASLGAKAARIGGAALVPAAVRVVVWGALEVAVTARVGALFGMVA